MAIAEALAVKTVSENFLHSVLSFAVGVCSTVWVCFAVFGRVATPSVIAERVGDFLGFTRVSEKLLPVVSWADEPRHLPLFLGAAAVAGVLFNLSATEVLKIRTVASEVAWLFFLIALQGAGFLATAGICIGVSCGALGCAWLTNRGEDRQWVVWIYFRANIELNALQAIYPLTLLGSWFTAAYRGDRPADPSREDPQPTGSAIVSFSPLRGREY
jgi:hypothetical protein